MFSPGTSGSFRRFLIVMLLVGPVMTVAVAWGCRWMTQRDHYVIDASIKWSNADRGFFIQARSRSLARRWWTRSIHGGDGREYVPQADPWRVRPVFPSWAAGEGFRWNNFGVEWIAVTWPAGSPSWSASSDADDWPPVGAVDIPAWSTVLREPLSDSVARLELAAGWPMPALWAEHLQPDGDNRGVWHALVTETTGSVYGYLPFSEVPQQILYRPLYRGFIFDSLFWSALIACAIALPGILWRARRGLRRKRRRRCAQCAYSAGASENENCPECGWPRNRLDCTRWSRASIVGGLLGLTLLAAEIVAVGVVLSDPEVSVLDQALFDGDLEVMRDEFNKPDWALRRADVRGSFRSDHLLTTALLSGQDGVVELLAEETGAGAPPASGLVSTQFIDTLVRGQFPSSTAVALISRHGLLDPERSSPASLEQLIQFLTRRTQHEDEATLSIFVVAMERLESRQVLWPMAMRWAVMLGAEKLVEALMESGFKVSTDLGVNRVRESVDVARLVLTLDVFRGDRTEPAPDLQARLALARRLIETTRVPYADQPGSWHSVLGAEAMGTALANGGRDGEAIVEMLLEYGLSEPVQPRDVVQLWRRGQRYVTSDPAQRGKWEAVIAYGADPAICDHDPGTGWTLWSWVDDREAGELVRFLLEHGAVLTHEIYDRSVPPVRAVLDTWMDEQGMTVDELPAMDREVPAP